MIINFALLKQRSLVSKVSLNRVENVLIVGRKKAKY